MLNIRHIVGAVLLFVSGLVKLISECKDFYELEKGTYELCQKVSNQVFTWVLEQIDYRLMEECPWIDFCGLLRYNKVCL